MSGPKRDGSDPVRPPWLARRIAAWMTRPDLRGSVLGDLDVEFETLLAEGVPANRAAAWYRGQVLRSALPLLRGRFRGTGPGVMRVSWLDVRLGIRMLGKYPGLTMAAVLSLAIGIPVGLAPWHAAEVFEAPLPVPDGDRIMLLKRYDPSTGRWAQSTVADGVHWGEGLEGFSAVGTVLRTTFNLDGEAGRDPAVSGAAVTAGGFRVLEVPPALGRLPGPTDDVPGAADVVVLGHDLWRTRYGGDPAVVGRVVRLGRVPHTVIGVMPAGFRFPYRDDLWIPLRSEEAAADPRAALVFGRLADGVDREAAEWEFGRLEAGAGATRADRGAAAHDRWIPMAVPFTQGLFGLRPGGLRAEGGFYFIQALALVVLVVACVNISMLLLVRTTSRTRELSVRTALGAGRTRIVLQLFMEALVLALFAAGAGLVVAHLIAGRLDFISAAFPYWAEFGVTWKTSLRAGVLACFSAAVIGVLPALRVTGGSIQRSIQRASSGRTGVRFGGVATGLIVADVALAVVATGLAFAWQDGITQAMPRGVGGVVAAEEYLTAEFRLPLLDEPDDSARVRGRNEAGHALLERVARDPAVRAVAMADAFPGMGAYHRYAWEVDGVDPPDGNGWRPVDVVQVVPGFFAALEQPVRSGRSFRPGEPVDDVPVAIVDTEFVERFMDGRSPVGVQIRPLRPGEPEPGRWYEVVGLVGGIGNSSADVRPTPKVYVAATPGQMAAARIAIHLGDDPTAWTGELRASATSVDPSAILADVRTLADARSLDADIFRWVAIGFRAMIVVLMALAASGTYALLAFALSERELELAVRAALGAPPSAQIRTIGSRAALQLGVGALLGMATTGGMMTLFVAGGWTPGISPILVTLASGLGVVLVVGLLAGLGPARRGLSIAPDIAVRG